MRYVMAFVACVVTSTLLRAAETLTYPIVGTNQHAIFSNTAQFLQVPHRAQPFFGQDGFYSTLQPRYKDNGDGTVSDLNTGLMWQKTPPEKLTFADAFIYARQAKLAGYADWRIPTIKELYSLIDFSGYVTMSADNSIPYLDTRYFDFRYGEAARNERVIDSQYWSSTQYLGYTMHGNATVFGVNFADGRIKGYPRDAVRPGAPANRMFLRLVRGNSQYGTSHFVDNKDGTISDLATGLMWAKSDSGKPMVWQDALAYPQNLTLAGYKDWRLPNAKELQSIVDYDRAPDATDRTQRGPSIDPIFQLTDAESWFWSSTTHLDGPRPGDRAVYLCFGHAWGNMQDPRTGEYQKLDVHGAGAQRSDPKSGNPADYPFGHGPQGDEQRIYNYARAVRNIDPATVQLVTPSTTPLQLPRIAPGFGPPQSPPGQPGPQRQPPQNRKPSYRPGLVEGPPAW